MINPYETPTHSGEHEEAISGPAQILVELVQGLIVFFWSPVIFLALGLWSLWERQWEEAVLMFALVFAMLGFLYVCQQAVLDSINLWK